MWFGDSPRHEFTQESVMLSADIEMDSDFQSRLRRCRSLFTKRKTHRICDDFPTRSTSNKSTFFRSNSKIKKSSFLKRDRPTPSVYLPKLMEKKKLSCKRSIVSSQRRAEQQGKLVNLRRSQRILQKARETKKVKPTVKRTKKVKSIVKRTKKVSVAVRKPKYKVVNKRNLKKVSNKKRLLSINSKIKRLKLIETRQIERRQTGKIS